MKKCIYEAKGFRNFALLVLRLCVSSIFIYHGWEKFMVMDKVIEQFGSWGIPVAGLFAYLVAVIESVGGVALFFGFFTKSFATLLSIVMIFVMIFVHSKGTFAEAQLAVALLGATGGLAVTGAGEWRLTKRECIC